MQMIQVTKVNEETMEEYQKWAWPSEGKEYSNFRHMEALLSKLGNFFMERYPVEFKEWLGNHQEVADFADYIIGKIPEPDGE